MFFHYRDRFFQFFCIFWQSIINSSVYPQVTSNPHRGVLKPIVLNPLGGAGGTSSLGLGKYYQDMSQNFYNSNLGNRNFFQVWKIFILWRVEIPFLNRLYLRNGGSWTSHTLKSQLHNFRYNFLIQSQNFKIR